MRQAVTPFERLLLTLRHLATGMYRRQGIILICIKVNWETHPVYFFPNERNVIMWSQNSRLLPIEKQL